MFSKCNQTSKRFAKIQMTTGCTMLGLMDVVYASDSATFHVPFTALALTPEACSSKTFPRFQLMYLAAIDDHLQIRKMTIWGTMIRSEVCNFQCYCKGSKHEHHISGTLSLYIGINAENVKSCGSWSCVTGHNGYKGKGPGKNTGKGWVFYQIGGVGGGLQA